MLEKAQKIVSQYNELSEKIAHPDTINDHNKLAVLAKEQSDLENLYNQCKNYIIKKESYIDNESLINDVDAELARTEGQRLL